MKKIIKHTVFIPTLILFLVSTTILIVWGYSHNFNDELKQTVEARKEIAFSPFRKSSNGKIKTKYKFTESYLRKKVVSFDTTVYIKKVSSKSKVPFEIDEKAGRVYKRIYSGKRINIAITGVDSRIGHRYKHADANHVLSILPEKKIIEIISIPRDTYADAGLDDTTNLNKLTNVRGMLGRKAYLNELANIAEVDKIHYYIEFGFSQAMAILKWLGYDNYHNTLQVLRSRKVFKGSDWQRTYNQGTFIKQMIIKNQHKFDGVFGNILVEGLLALVETNLNQKKAVGILDKFRINEIEISDSLFKILVRPKLKIKFKSYDFTDKSVIAELSNQIRLKGDSSNIKTSKYVIKTLEKAIHKSVKDSLNRPLYVIRNLKTYYNQKAWHQILDKTKMDWIREDIKVLLSEAYFKLGKDEKGNSVIENIDNEKELFKKKESFIVNYSSIVKDSLVGFNNLKESIENINSK